MHNDPEYLYRIVLGISLPSRQPDRKRMRGILTRAARAMENSNMKIAADMVRESIANDRNPLASYARAWAERPARTRATEDRRLGLIRVRVRESGFELTR